MSVVIFAPSPVLTVTIEGKPDGVDGDVHVHAGGQGVWQARMLRRLGVEVTICCVLTGESGRVLRHLMEDEGLTVIAVERPGRGGAYVHDRRDGERHPIIETAGEPLSRHELDEVYGEVLGAGLDASLVILSGPASEDALPADVYRRLAADLRTAKRRVLADLAGDRLDAAIAGGAYLIKVSDEELVDDGRIAESTTENIIEAMTAIHEAGVSVVVVTRADQPLLMLAEGILSEVATPTMEVADHRGAGDSLTAGIAASLSAGESPREAIVLGAAAGTLNVTRHGLGTGDADTISRFTSLVTVRELGRATGSSSTLSPDELARRLSQS